MAIPSVSDFSSFINHQTKTQEKIEASLWKLEALVAVAVMADGFYDLSEATLRNYFSVASDLIEKATEANQSSLRELMQCEPTD